MPTIYQILLFLLCAHVSLPLSPSPSQSSVVIATVDFGFSQVVACQGVAIKVVWTGYHNIQETQGSSCTSADINAQITGYHSSGHEADYTNDELSAAPGTTRYFKCSTHCGTSASRFEVSCPAATNTAAAGDATPSSAGSHIQPDTIIGGAIATPSSSASGEGGGNTGNPNSVTSVTPSSVSDTFGTIIANSIESPSSSSTILPGNGAAGVGNYQSPSPSLTSNLATFNPNQYSNTMTISALVNISGIVQMNGTLVVVDEVGGVRGIQSVPSIPTFGPFANLAIFQIMAYGDSSGETTLHFQFHLFMAANNAQDMITKEVTIVIVETVQFSVNGNVGNAVAPFDRNIFHG